MPEEKGTAVLRVRHVFHWSFRGDVEACEIGLLFVTTAASLSRGAWRTWRAARMKTLGTKLARRWQPRGYTQQKQPAR